MHAVRRWKILHRKCVAVTAMHLRSRSVQHCYDVICLCWQCRHMLECWLQCGPYVRGRIGATCYLHLRAWVRESVNQHDGLLGHRGDVRSLRVGGILYGERLVAR